MSKSQEVYHRYRFLVATVFGVTCIVISLLVLFAKDKARPAGEVTAVTPQECLPKLFFREDLLTPGPKTAVKLGVNGLKATSNPSYKVATYAYVRLRLQNGANQLLLTPRCEGEVDFIVSTSMRFLKSLNEDTSLNTPYEEGWMLVEERLINQEDLQWEVPLPCEKKTIQEVRVFLAKN